MMRRSPSRAGSFAQRQFGRFGRGGEADAHLAVFPQQRVRGGFHGGNLVGRQLLVEIDGGRRAAEMKTHGLRTGLALERRGEQVLPRVLLHVIEPAIPVDVPAHPAILLELAIDDVRDVAVLAVEHVEHPGLADRAGVEGLAAGRRIERRAIEHELPPIVLCARRRERRRRIRRGRRRCNRGGLQSWLTETTDRARPLRRSLWRAARSCRTGRTARHAGADRSSCA